VLFSLIVPVHNGGASFRLCLDSVAALAPAPFELIVVTNGTSDGSDVLARSFGAIVIALPSAVGPARARNIGAAAARGDGIVFIDADVAVPPDLIARIAAAFGADPGLAALIGSYDDAPADPGFFSQYKNLLHHYTHQTANADASTFWGACGAIRRAVFSDVGGFDESFARPSVEDIALGYRLKAAGHRIVLVRTIQVKHHKRYTALSMVRSDFFDRALPWTRLLLTYRQFSADLNLTHSARASVALVYLLAGSLCAALLWRPVLLASLGCALALLLLNRAVYAWLWHRRGGAFALRAVPWHWMYYLYSGAAFVIGSIEHRLGYTTQKGKPA